MDVASYREDKMEEGTEEVEEMTACYVTTAKR